MEHHVEAEEEVEDQDMKIIPRPQRAICTGNLEKKVGHVQIDIIAPGEILRAQDQEIIETSAPPQLKLLIEKLTNLTKMFLTRYTDTSK